MRGGLALIDPVADWLTPYFHRISLPRPVHVDVAGVGDIQRAHRAAIAFENFDIRLGRGIDLAPERVFDKLVIQRRGGYCFEHNGLFGRVLTALGLSVTPLLARVWLGLADDAPPPPRTHLILAVTIAGRAWLADAGFGAAGTAVMPIEDGAEAIGADGVPFRLRRDGPDGWMLERGDRRGGWLRQYGFSADPVWPADIAMANHYTASAPESRFVRTVVLSRLTPGADFISLVDRRLSLPEGAADLPDAGAYRRAVAERFGLALSDGDVARLGLYG